MAQKPDQENEVTVDHSDLFKSLQSTDRYVGDNQRRLLRLFFSLLAVISGKDVEEAMYLSDFFKFLEEAYREYNPVHILQYMLEFIGVQQSGKLGASNKDLKACGELKEMAFPSLIVSVCMDLQTKDFDKLNHNLCLTALKCNSANIKSCDELMLELYHQEIVKPKELHLLIDGLEEIGRKDIANRVRYFVQTGKFEHRTGDIALSSSKSCFKPSIQESGPGDGVSQLQSEIGARNDGESRDLSSLSPEPLSDNVLTVGPSTRSGEPVERLNQPQTSNAMPFLATGGQPMNDPVEGGVDQAETTVNASVSRRSLDEESPLISPTENKSLCSCLKKYKCKLLIALIILLCSYFFIAGGSTVGLFFWYVNIIIIPIKSVFAAANETIVEVAHSDPFIWWSIRECHVSSDDYSHSNQLYIDSNELLRHSRNVSTNYTKVYNQPDTDCGSSILSHPLYMLEGSSIEVKICISASTDPEPGQNGVLVIFDDNKAFVQYTSNGDCWHTDGAAYVHNLNIGSPGHFECTPVSFKVTTNGHLYALPVIPGVAQYYYQYNYTQFYLDPNDFGNLKCTVSIEGNNECSIGFISSTPVYLVVHVKPNTVENSPYTHLCFRRDWSHRLIELVGILGLTAFASLIAAVVLSHIYHKYKNKKQLHEPAVRQPLTNTVVI